MNEAEIKKIFDDLNHVRIGGRDEEKAAAAYISNWLLEKELHACTESFEVPLGNIENAVLIIDGQQIPSKGYMCSGSADIEAPFYYLRSSDPFSLAQCSGKIVLIDGYLRYWMYQDLLNAGAVGFITYDGHINYADRDIDNRELRSYIHNGFRIPGMNINVKDAAALISHHPKTARIIMSQCEYTGTSQNVRLDLPGEIDEYITFTAHYDSTPLSHGIYDNLTGSIGLMALAERYASGGHRYGLRFLWCGSEERGLLGSKAYCETHADELEKTVLNINLDMIGSIMGKFIACASAEEKLVHYVEYLSLELGFGLKASQDVYSSDSTPFADHGVPAISFARIAPNNAGTIHNRYDTAALIDCAQLRADVVFIERFTDRMCNAALCPVSRTIPESVQEKLDYYMNRKRKPE